MSHKKVLHFSKFRHWWFKDRASVTSQMCLLRQLCASNHGYRGWQDFVWAMSQPPPRPPWNYSETFMGCSEYIFRQTNISCHHQLCNIKLNNSGQSLKMTTGDFKQRCARPIQFFFCYISVNHCCPLSKLSPCSMSNIPILFSVWNFTILCASRALRRKGSLALTISIGSITRSRWGSCPGSLKCRPTVLIVSACELWMAVPRCPDNLCVKLLVSPSPQMPT